MPTQSMHAERQGVAEFEAVVDQMHDISGKEVCLLLLFRFDLIVCTNLI